MAIKGMDSVSPRDVNVRTARNVVLRGGIFSSRHIVKGRALIAFGDFKTSIDDFAKRKLTAEELPAVLENTRRAFERMREKIRASDHELKDTLLIMLSGIGGNVGLEGHILEVMEQQQICAASAADIYLQQKGMQKLKASPVEQLRNVYDQTASLLVDLLNEKRNSVGDIRQALDDSPGPVVLVCRDIPDTEVSVIKHPKVAAVVREEGGKRDHKTVILKNLSRLGVVGVRGVMSVVATGDHIIVNGFSREVVIRPLPQTVKRMDGVKEHLHRVEHRLAGERSHNAETLDGHRVRLNLNISAADEISALAEFGYDDVGLVRTEYPLGTTPDGYPRRAAPDVKTQVGIYQEMIDALHQEREGRRPDIHFRMADIDGDKSLPYLALSEADRALIKEKGFGMFLDPQHFQLYLLLKNQLEALLRLKGKRSIMFPNVFRLGDFAQAMSVVDEIAREHRLTSRVQDEVSFGIMVEHPGVVRDLKAAKQGMDAAQRKAMRMDDLKFASLGTNDLTRFTLGVGRGDPGYDEMHPDVLSNVLETVLASEVLGLEVSLCGDAGNDPLALLALLGLGVRRMSLTPDFVDVGRRIIRSVNMEDAENLAASLKGVTTAEQVRQIVSGYVEMRLGDSRWKGLELVREFILD